MATERTTAGESVIVAAFHTQDEAQHAVRELKNAGFTDEQIGVASQDRAGTSKEQIEGNQAGEGAAIGATAGLGAGALWGLGIVAGVLPAIGPVIAGGALAAVAASAAGTAVAGGLVGALAGLGIPEDEAEYYQGELERGRTVVTVRASGASESEARRILDQSNAYDYNRRESAFAQDPNAPDRFDYSGQRVARNETAGASRGR